MSEEKKRFYYLEDGTIKVTPFYDEIVEEELPFIELTFEEWERDLSTCSYGFKKAYRDGKIIEVADEELQASEEYKSLQKEIEITNLKNYLTETDYIIAKLNEAKIEDENEFRILKIKYSDVIAKRKEARERINTLEQELSQLEQQNK